MFYIFAYKFLNDMISISIDMDEVMSNFKKLHQAEFTEENIYPQSRAGFFQELEPIPGSIEAVKKLIADPRFEVFILTAPSYHNPYCYMDKRIWIEKYFGVEFCKQLVICYHKERFIADILIDDSEKNGQLKFKGELIKFGSEKFPNWDEVMKYLDTYQSKTSLMDRLKGFEVPEVEEDSYMSKLIRKRGVRDRWTKRIKDYMESCTDDQMETFLKWEKKYQRYCYDVRNMETSSNIFEIVTSIVIKTEDFKFRGYTLEVHHGQGVHISVVDKDGNYVI